MPNSSTISTEPLPIPDDEFANTLTHCIGILIAIVGFGWMAFLVSDRSIGVKVSCLVYVASVVAVFVFSTLSHAVKSDRLRQKMRAWDQGMIYVMISGTYMPFVWQYGGSFRWPLLVFIWVAAALGFWSKAISQHRVNALSTLTYLLLGWIPAIPLSMQVPAYCLLCMTGGGVLYTIGVAFLMSDHRVRYFHATWHLLVICAAAVHYLGIVIFVAR